ncbi:hypothetical protein [Alkalinema sp. FACHB-956]|uniref:hypothetical protein n=1 Tax=Alkalinema sp. FACHB-956 TaxID=2692768 RepID=UPI0018F02311|nr:hypothetical protein [Alkalinema sp. FACHB-956]
MSQLFDISAELMEVVKDGFTFQLPDPDDEAISEVEFQQKIELAWQVCDRFDLQTDIWRGRILRTIRDREKHLGEGRSAGFLNWLKDREISRSHAYNLIDLANSADHLLEQGYLETEDINQFTKRAFVATAQSAPEVQQMIADSAKQGNKITRREVRQLSDEWTAMTSDLLPEEVRAKAADQTIPPKYLAPLVKQMEKLPEVHQVTIRDAVADSPNVDTLKQVTAEARYLARYLESANQVQALSESNVDLELALEEALRVGVLNSTAELVNQAAALESTIAKLYTTWRRINQLSERLYVDTGASTPHLRGLLSRLDILASDVVEVTLGDPQGQGFSRTIRLTIAEETLGGSPLSDVPPELGTWEVES